MRTYTYRNRIRNWTCRTKNVRLALCEAGLCRGLSGCLLPHQTSRATITYLNCWQPEGLGGNCASARQQSLRQARKASAQLLRALAPIGGVNPPEVDVA